MRLTEDEGRFLRKRKKMVRAWPYAGGVMLVLIIGIMVQMFITQPIMLNPFIVMEQVNEGLIETGTLHMMAMMVPVMFLLCFSLVIIAVILGFSVIQIEKRYIGIITREETA